MTKRAALAVAAEAFFEVGPPRQWAGTDTRDLLQSLQNQGYRPCLFWTGHHTTQAALRSHLHRLPQNLSGIDELLVLWITRTWIQKGMTHLACADTLRDDPMNTSLTWSEILKLVRQAVPEAAILWLCDFDPLELAHPECQPGWNEEELAATANDKQVFMTAAAGRECSWTSATLQRGLWRHHLLEAFQGQAVEALDEQGRLSLFALHRYLDQAVPRTLRKTHEGAHQTPLCFPTLSKNHPAGERILAQFEPRQVRPFDWLDPRRLQRILFRSERPGRVKELSGFRKSHNIPERVNAWARRFVQRIGASDLKADLDEVYERIREHFGYKRKDVETSGEDAGYGAIRTPDFEYAVLLELDSADPSQVVWRREVGQLASLDVVRHPAFRHVFGDRLDQLVFEFLEPQDVAAFVDRFESDPPPGARIRLDSDASQAEITLSGFAGRVCVTAHSATVFGRPGDPTTLLDQFLTFLPKYWESAPKMKRPTT